MVWKNPNEPFLVNPVALNLLSGKNCEMKKKEIAKEDYMCCVCCAELLSRVRLFETPWTVAHHAPLSMSILQARMLE